MKKILEENPAFSKLARYTLIIPKDEYDEFPQEEQEFALIIVELILSEKKYKEYVTKLFKGVIDKFQIAYPCNGDLCGNKNLTRKKILDYFEIAKRHRKYTKEEQEYINRLKKLSGIDAFAKLIYKEKYKEEIDGNTFEVLGKHICELLTLDEEKYWQLINENKDKKELYYLFYVASKVFSKENVTKNYDFGPEINQRIHNILNYKDLDFETLNQLTTPKIDDFEINLDPRLEEKIIKDIPDELTIIEKAMYIYLKMCTIFMYDEEYFAVNLRGPAAFKHQYPEYISTINLENNELVCFEFNAIYAYFLKKLNIYYEIVRNASDSYGLGHEYLIFRVGKFLVDADSVTNVFYGDMTNVVTHAPIVGLKCINENEETKDEFGNMLKKVYNIIQDEISYRSTFYQSVSDYKTLKQVYGENDPRISFKERVKMLVEYIETSNMQNMRAYTYLLFLKNRLFSDNELKNNIDIRLVKNEKTTNSAKLADVMAIIAINEKDLKSESEENIYVIYKVNKGFVKVSKETLEDLFTSHVGYIDREDKQIPGLN